MVRLLLAKARLKSEGTHWKTIKERTGCVCRNVQGRGRQNAPHQNARGTELNFNVRGKSHGVTDEKRHGRTHSGKLSNNAQGGALGTHGTTYSETRGKWKGRRMNKREACAFIKPRGVPRSATEPSQTFNHFDRYGFTNVSRHI